MNNISITTNGNPQLSSSAGSTGTPSPLPLPNWDNAEVEKRLKENAEALKEWNALLDKADIAAAKNEDVPQADINQHNALKRKLHENLGIMAKMVQAQIKQKKPMDGVSQAAPIAKPMAA